MKKIQIINGPNLNLLGVREPGIYGSSSFEKYLPELRAQYPDVQIDYYQSNIEGELINKLQEVGFSYDGIVLNALLSRCIYQMCTSARSFVIIRISHAPVWV